MDVNHVTGVAAQLRLIADLMESGRLNVTAGSIQVSSDHRGVVSVNSNLTLLCLSKQPEGETPTIEEITLREPLEEAVYQWLEDMGENDKKCMTFEFGDEDQCEAWKRVINNRGEYPPKLHSRVFVLKPFRTSVEVGFWAMRVL